MAATTTAPTETDFPAPDFKEIIVKLTNFAGAAERILRKVSQDCFDRDGKLDTSRLLMLIPAILAELKK